MGHSGAMLINDEMSRDRMVEKRWLVEGITDELR